MPTYKVADHTDVFTITAFTKYMAAGIGFCERDQVYIAIAVSELATNIVKYAGKGEISLEFIDGAFVVTARDSGPGIKNVELAFTDHWTDSQCLLSGDAAGHRGRGVGLPAVKRLMDECEIVNTGSDGTTLRAMKILR